MMSNIYDQFDDVAKPQANPYDQFEEERTLPQGNPYNQFDPQQPPQQAASATIPSSSSAATPPSGPREEHDPSPGPSPGSQPGAFSRGFVTTLTQQNPELMGEFLDAAADMAPESFGPTLREGANWLREGAKRWRPEEYATQSKGLWNIQGFGDAATWVGETVGGGVASMLPSVAAGGVGAGVGAAVAGPPGATVGAVGGALASSLPFSLGEMRKALREEGLEGPLATKYATMATPALAGLDVAGLAAGPLGKLVGVDVFKREVSRHLARRVAGAVASGASAEGVTEALQAGVREITTSLVTGKPFWTVDTAKKVVEEGIAGALTGGAVGGPVGAIQRPTPSMIPPSPEALQQMYQDSTRPLAAASGGVVYVDDDAVLPEQDRLSAAGAQRAQREAKARPPEESPVFYSQLRRVVEKGPNAASGQQWNATILNAGGVKDEELETAQLNRILSDEDGNLKERITKQELVEFLEERSIDVKTTFRRLPSGTTVDLRPSRYRAGAWTDETGTWEISRARPGDRYHIERYDEEGGVQTPDMLGGGYLTVQDAQNALTHWLAAESIEGAPRYGMISFPGADSPEAYIEALLTLPVPTDEELGIPKEVITMREQALVGARRRYPQWARAFESSAEPLAMLRRAERENMLTRGESYAMEAYVKEKQSRADKSGQIYREPHWDELNVFAHMRGDARVDVDGAHGFYLDEVQSKWVQEGRKTGFREGKAEWSAKQVSSGPGQFENRWEVITPDGASEIVSGVRSAEEAIRNVQGGFRRGTAPKVPDMPFKKSWQDLALKRMVRWAADQGFERLYIPPSSVHTKRYNLQGEQAKGKQDFYDRILPNAMERMAKRVGARTGKTSLPFRTGVRDELSYLPVRYIELTPEVRTRVQKGFPMFNRVAQGQGEGTRVTVEAQPDVDKMLIDAAMMGGEAVLRIAQMMGIKKPIEIQVFKGKKGADLANVSAEGVNERGISWEGNFASKAKFYTIKVFPHKHLTQEAVMSSLMHELGHIIVAESYFKAPLRTRLAVSQAFEEWRKQNSRPDTRFSEMLVGRDSHVVQMSRQRFTRLAPGEDPLMTEFETEDHRYWYMQAEWMAEQVSKWLQTDQRPMSVVERFFKAIADKIRKLRVMFEERFGISAAPPQALAEWLDSLANMDALPYAESRRGDLESTRRQADTVMRQAGHPEFPSEPQQAETNATRDLLEQLRLLDEPNAKVSLVLADRFNAFYKYMLSLVQVADSNLHIGPLQRYRDTWEIMQLERANMMNRALTTLKGWKELSREESDNLARFMDDYLNMNYRSKDEVDNKVVRMPTAAEMDVLRTQHKITDRGLRVFNQVRSDFDAMISTYEALLLAEADKVLEPQARINAMTSVQEKIAALRAQPYLPAMRFGDFSIVIRNAKGSVIHFETFPTKRRRKSAIRELQGRLPKGAVIHEGLIPEDARPFIGMPPGLLDLMEERLNLSQSQINALEYLRFELSPAQSFKHRFQMQNKTPGYSLDWQRSYANFFFHGSNYITRVKYKEALQKQIRDVRDSGDAMPDGTKRHAIANYMRNHMDYMMDPRPDWGALRALATFWALGFSPAAASLNLSQLVVGSWPFLSSKFGDLKASAALLKAGAQVSTYYKRANLANTTDEEVQAISQGIKEGFISEALAPELATATEYDNLRGFGRIKRYEVQAWTMEKAMWLFGMTEQMNRRITFRAAWKLAKENPAAPYIDEVVNKKHKLLYERLRQQGWTEENARAFVVGKDAVETTQYVYAQWAQPRFMRGKARTVFVFKAFLQNTLFMLWNHPKAAARSLLVMAALGGLMGVPGAEDLRGIVKALAWRLFKKDLDIDEEVRRFVLDNLNGVIPADLVLHGAARRGFGIPAALDMVGVPAPTFDRSRAIGLGNILPVDIGVLAGPAKDQSRAIAESMQKASGAAFGIGFNLYKFLTDSQLSWDNAKRWQLAMPRSLASATKAYRYYSEGYEKNRHGDVVVRFDVKDTKQMMEVIGTAMGYQPTRLAAQWDRIIAEREAVMMWNMRREGLLRQLWNARSSGDEEEYDRVLEGIRNFNRTLPDHAVLKAISNETINRSFRTRAQSRNARESGTPRVRSDVPIVREIQRLYPEAEVDVRGVK